MQPENANYVTQILTCLCVDLLALSYGTSVGWVSPSLALLKSEDSPLKSGQLTIDDISMIGSAGCIGGFVAACIYGWVTDKIGRKFALISLGIFQLMGWIFIYFAQNSYYLIASRVLHGFAGGGTFIVIPLFVTEISEDRIRGRLGSLVVLSSNVGILLAFIICAYVDYYTNCIILFMINVLFFIGVSFIHESPLYLLKRNRHEAERSLRFYRSNLRYSDVETRSKVTLECEKMLSFIKSTDSDLNNKIRAADFFTKAAVRSIIIGIALMIFEFFNGTFALLSYASLIFDEAGSTLSPNNSAIVVAVIQIVGVYISTILVDRAGRKILLMTSAACCTIGLTTFSVYDFMKVSEYDISNFTAVPLICFSFVIFSANFGLLSLPFVILPEITPMKIKSIVYSFNISFSWIVAMVTVAYLPSSIDAIGINGTMAVFAMCCFSAVIFIGTYIPETKNRSIEEIQEIMSE